MVDRFGNRKDIIWLLNGKYIIDRVVQARKVNLERG